MGEYIPSEDKHRAKTSLGWVSTSTERGPLLECTPQCSSIRELPWKISQEILPHLQEKEIKNLFKRENLEFTDLRTLEANHREQRQSMRKLFDFLCDDSLAHEILSFANY